MTFLELCQRLRAECQDLGSGHETVTGQTGRNQRYVDAIRENALSENLLALSAQTAALAVRCPDG